jgi:hypothetical protein
MFEKFFLAFTWFTSCIGGRTWHNASGPRRKGLFRAGQVHIARARSEHSLTSGGTRTGRLSPLVRLKIC